MTDHKERAEALLAKFKSTEDYSKEVSIGLAQAHAMLALAEALATPQPTAQTGGVDPDAWMQPSGWSYPTTTVLPTIVGTVISDDSGRAWVLDELEGGIPLWRNEGIGFREPDALLGTVTRWRIEQEPHSTD